MKISPKLDDIERPKTQAQIKDSLTALFAWELDSFTASRDGFEIRVCFDNSYDDSVARALVVHTGGSHTLCAEGEDLEAASARLWGMLGKKVR